MTILGIGGAFGHDPAAALLIDGRLVAAAEEERFLREKHAFGKPAIQAGKFVLEMAGIHPSDVDLVAFPFSPDTQTRQRSAFARRMWTHDPVRSVRAYTEHGRKIRKRRNYLRDTLRGIGIPETAPIREVDHHLAHASSAFHLSGWETAAILSIDGAGGYTATLVAEGRPDGSIHEIASILEPDSLGHYFAGITEYLGFLPNDGEFKVMGMAPYGDPSRVDLGFALRVGNGRYRVEDGYWWVPRRQRSGDLHCSRKLVQHLGPARVGDECLEPYIHIAAAAQRQLEAVAVHLLEHHLAGVLSRNGGRLCVSGGCALNVKMNQVLLEHPLVNEIFVQPVANDAGSAMGAATYAAWERGDRVEAMRHLYLGPEFSDAEISAVLAKQSLPHSRPDSITETVAQLLAEGKICAWFQGRMEFGPRALGNRSILANPSVPGMTDEINLQIKFREKWRPFCPSVLHTQSAEVLGSTHPAPYMILAFDAVERVRTLIREAVHIDGSIRPQVVDPAANPRYHALLHRFHELTGVPAVINTSLNRRGEPMICGPEEALDMFRGSGLQYLALGDHLVTKQ